MSLIEFAIPVETREKSEKENPEIPESVLAFSFSL
jgi:hypothetical protein